MKYEEKEGKPKDESLKRLKHSNFQFQIGFTTVLPLRKLLLETIKDANTLKVTSDSKGPEQEANTQMSEKV